jgi:phosphomannomutase
VISADFVLRLGNALGRVLVAQRGQDGRRPIVVIGKDTRISGYMFEAALEAGLVAAGADVQLLGPMPTPAVAFLTRTLGVDAGIVISASHNPHYDNGIKFFSAQGEKLDDATELAWKRRWTFRSPPPNRRSWARRRARAKRSAATSSSARPACRARSTCVACAWYWIAHTAPPTRSHRCCSANWVPK